MSIIDIKYPHVTVQLSGEDGNGATIIGRVRRALRREVSAEAATEWSAAAMSCGSYDELLRLAMATVDVE